MKTVTTCQFKKEWSANGRSGKIYEVTLSDGTKGECFADVPPGTPESELEITPSQYGNKIKWNKPNRGGFQGGGKRVGNESFALAYAKDFGCAMIAAGKEFKSDQIIQLADKFYGWMETKKS